MIMVTGALSTERHGRVVLGGRRLTDFDAELEIGRLLKGMQCRKLSAPEQMVVVGVLVDIVQRSRRRTGRPSEMDLT